MFNLKRFFLGTKSSFKMRAPRIQPGPLENCWVLFRQGNLLHKLELLNISTSGFAFSMPETLPFELKKNYKATLALGTNKIETEFQVIHLEEHFLGCAFDQSHLTVAGEILSYFKVQLAAHLLAPVNSRYLKSHFRHSTFWYTDGRHNEIYYQIENNEVCNYQITFLGHYLMSVKEGAGVTSFECSYRPTEYNWRPAQQSSDSSWNVEIKKLAKQFILHAPAINDKHKQALISAIDRSVFIQSNDLNLTERK